MKIRGHLAALAAGVVLFYGCSIGETAALSIQEAVDLALAQNTSLRITEKGEETARANLKGARGANSFNVGLNGTLTDGRTNDEARQDNGSISLRANLPLYTGGKNQANIESAEIGVDAASFAAHKVCGPKGVGALYLKARTPFSAIALGGGQEDARRSGTQNVCGAAGFAAACHAAVQLQPAESERQMALRDRLYCKLGAIPGVRATVDVAEGSREFLPNIVHVLVCGYESETLVLRLDALGFGVSGGSACSSHSLDPSHVLTAMGISRDDALGSLRVSLGRYTTEEDIDGFAQALANCIS